MNEQVITALSVLLALQNWCHQCVLHADGRLVILHTGKCISTDKTYCQFFPVARNEAQTLDPWRQVMSSPIWIQLIGSAFNVRRTRLPSHMIVCWTYQCLHEYQNSCTRWSNFPFLSPYHCHCSCGGGIWKQPWHSNIRVWLLLQRQQSRPQVLMNHHLQWNINN